MPPESRPNRRWAGAILAIAGVLIAIGAWLLPDPGQRLCGLSGDRFSGCSDIPSAYIGRWTGTLTAVDYGILYSPTKKEFPSTLTIQRARIDHGVAAREQGDESSCANAMRRCTPDLSVMVKLAGADALEVEITSGPNTSPLILPAGLRIAHGTLRRA